MLLKSQRSNNGSQNPKKQHEKCEKLAAIKQVLPENFYKTIIPKVLNFGVYDDDVWVVTAPKAGTHWMQETLCCLLHGMDFEKLKSTDYKRAINVELPAIKVFDGLTHGETHDLAKFSADLERPRVMKTHLSWDNLPKMLRDPNSKAKIVYVARNPKDVCVSRFYYAQMVPGNWYKERTQTLDSYAGEFLRGERMYTHTDLSKVLDRLQVFLGLDPLTPQQKAALSEYLSFDKMKKNKAVMDFMHCDGKVYRKTYSNAGGEANFMRQGKAGGWKQEMPPEMIKRFDEWILENTAGTGYTVDVE